MIYIYIDTLCRLKTRLHLTLSLGQKKKKAYSFYSKVKNFVLTYLHARVLGVLTCLACSRAYVFSMLACFYVLMCSHVLHACCAQISNVLSACVLLRHGLSYFLYIWKVNFQKSLYRKISFYSENYLEPTWTSMKKFLRKRIKG